MADTGAPCTYCGEGVDFSAGDLGDSLDFLAGDPGDGQGPASDMCSYRGGFHADCIWDRTERLVNGRVEPHHCVCCRSGWPVRSRPLGPTELAQGLLRSSAEVACSGEYRADWRTLCGRSPSTVSSQLRDRWLPRHVRADGEDPRDESTLLVPMLPVQRRSGRAFARVHRFPPLSGMGSSG